MKEAWTKFTDSLIAFTIPTFLAVMAAVLYLLTLKGVPGNPLPSQIKNGLDQAAQPFELSPERGRWALVQSLVEDHSFALSELLANAVYPDVGYYQGRYYVYFGPAISVAAIPLYVWGKAHNLAQVATFSISSIFALFNLLLIYYISRTILKMPPWASIFSGLVFGFATTSWSYATTLYQHHFTTFCILSGFVAVWKYKHANRLGWMWSLYVWGIYGLSIFADYPNAILVAPIVAYMLLSAISARLSKDDALNISLRASVIAGSIVFAGISVLHAYFNYKHFGAWNHLSGTLVGLKSIREEKILEQSDAVSKLEEKAQKKSNPVKFFSEENFPFGLYTLTVSDDRGLLLYSPILVLGMLGLINSFGTKRLENGVLAAIALTVLFLYSSWGDPWGGWAFGPRYLIPAMSILSIYVGWWVGSNSFDFKRRLVAWVLFVYSAGVALLGALTTNAVPPKIEGVFLKMDYNFLRNLEFLRSGRSSSYLFNQLLNRYYSLTDFYLVVLLSVSVIALALLFSTYTRRKYET